MSSRATTRGSASMAIWRNWTRRMRVWQAPASSAKPSCVTWRVSSTFRRSWRPDPLLEAHPTRRLAHPDHPRRDSADHRVGGHILCHHRVRSDDRVVADRHPAEDAGAIADPHVVAHARVALVDALEADRPFNLHHAVVEVDQHHAVGDHALAPDRHVLEGGDRALLAHHRLRPDRDNALVAADLRAVPEPGPAPELDSRALSDLERDARADEAQAVEL